ncbi:MAG: hypothetical protein AAGA76_01175 [Pseudomonadota bacterium]
MNSIIKTSMVTAVVATIATPALAKNWVDTVSVKRNGIDVAPIEVNANANGYTNIRTANHKFLLTLSASAKKGKRLVAGRIGAYNGVDYFEAGHPKFWDKKVKPKVFTNLGKKKISFAYSPTIAVSKVSWTGGTPVEVCRKHMNKHAKSASAKKAFLAKPHMISAMATFQFDIVAAKKKAAKKNKWHVGKSGSKRSNFTYQVNVKCLPGV